MAPKKLKPIKITYPATATIKPKKVIFEYCGLTVTEYDSIFQIGRLENGVIIATVMKYPPGPADKAPLFRIKKLVEVMHELGY